MTVIWKKVKVVHYTSSLENYILKCMYDKRIYLPRLHSCMCVVYAWRNDGIFRCGGLSIKKNKK